MNEQVFINPSFDGLPKDLFFAQNEPSVLTVHILNVKAKQPRPGERVLDMCAAPGGKTTHIGALMQNRGSLVSIEKSQSRFKELARNTENWGLTCCELLKTDATRCVELLGENSFDKVLLDPPCSGLGQKPRLEYPSVNVKSLVVVQRKLLKQAVGCLRPGGCLVYSTCTVTPEENSENIEWALSKFPLELLEQGIYIGFRTAPLSLAQETSPSVNSTGFYIAFLRKL